MSDNSATQGRQTPLSAGVHHVGLTVPDVGAAGRIFTEALGFRVVGGKPAYPAVFVSDGVTMLTLWQAREPGSATPFDRHSNLGLHHLALRVADEMALDEAHRRLVAAGAMIEFPPENLGEGPTRHMMCTIVGGLRLEIITSPPATTTAQ